jgi:hypothetical protein
MTVIEPRFPAFPAVTYYYRRPLAARELLPAVAVGVGVGVAAFYVARLLLQRTPLERERSVPVVGRSGALVRRAAARPAAG